jgi:hypothetical protein
MPGRKKIYATPEDRHRAYRARLGMVVRKPVVLANGVIRKVEKVPREQLAQTRP